MTGHPLRRESGTPPVPVHVAEWLAEHECQVVTERFLRECIGYCDDLAGVTEALDWAKAPTTDDALAGVERALGAPQTGYRPAGRVRALYSRERIAANRLRSERDRYWQALTDIAGWETWQSETWREIAKKALGDG